MSLIPPDTPRDGPALAESASLPTVDAGGATLTRVVVGHPGALVRMGLAELLRRTPDTHLLASVASAEETLAAIRQHRPALAIIAPEFRALVVEVAQPPRIMLVSPHDHAGLTTSCRHSCAFASERASVDTLLDTLDKVLACTRIRGEPRPCVRCPLRASLVPPPLPLSSREQQVFELIADGRVTGQIARALGLSIKTVETYRANIKHKLGLDSSMALTEAAVLWRRGIHTGNAGE